MEVVDDRSESASRPRLAKLFYPPTSRYLHFPFGQKNLQYMMLVRTFPTFYVF